MKTKILLVVLLPVIAGVAFYTGHTNGYSEGNISGRSTGYAKAREELDPQLRDGSLAKLENVKLHEDYNKLVNDYNFLVKQASKPVYQPRQSLSCTSYDYGVYSNFTTTNCF